MDFSKIAEELKQATLFDLHRLRVLINHRLENPEAIKNIKRRLRQGQTISYFDRDENRLIEAKVIKLKRTLLLVENIHDKQRWDIPFYWVNLEEVDTEIAFSSGPGVEKSQLKVGDTVTFQDKRNNDIFGKVLRLNKKTATIITNNHTKWRVSFNLLSVVIDADKDSPYLIEHRCSGN